MTRLEAALRHAIADLDPSDREGRRIALGNVRASMMRLLAVYEPPLSAAEIEGKIDEVDALIDAIEAEFAPPAPGYAGDAAEDGLDDLAWEMVDAEAGADFADEAEPGPDEAIDDVPDGDAGLAPPRRTPPRLVIGLAVALASIAGAAVFVALAPGGSVTQGRAPTATMSDAAPAASADAATTATGQTPAEQTADPAAPSASGTAADGPASPERPSAAPSKPAPTADAPAASPSSDAATAPVSPAPAATVATAPAEAAPVAPPPGPPASESLIVFDGHDPSLFRSTADNPVHFEGGTDGGYVRISSSPNSNGARLTVGPGVYQRLAGKTIRVVVVARAAPESPAATIRMAYLSGRKLSSWSDQSLGDAYRSLAMDWTVPADRSGKQDDAVLIEPGIPGDQTAVDIRSVTIDVLP